MYIHDLIKIHLVREGYLPNYPYHLISDAEMCDAFFNEEDESKSYFHATYPRSMASYLSEPYVLKDCKGKPILDKDGNQIEETPYEGLERVIRYYMNKLKTTKDDTCVLPDWVYSYMLGSVISIQSGPLDVHDLIKPLGADNIDDEFTPEAALACYKTSKLWIRNTLIDVWEHNANGVKSTDCPGCQNLRPPTMFGEPHIIKSIRLSDASPI